MKHSQAAIMLLLVLNLATTAWFGLQSSDAPAPQQQPVATRAVSVQLPQYVTKDYRDSLLKGFMANFNKQDYDAMYQMLGPVARSQIPAETARSEFEKLSSYFDQVKSGQYARAELTQKQGDTSVYVLHYDVNFSDKSQAPKGSLKINLATNSTGAQVYGIRLNSL